MNTLKIYTCNNFTGHWPVPTAAVVIAENQEDAAGILSIQLNAEGLQQDVYPDQMVELYTDQKRVILLSKGDY